VQLLERGPILIVSQGEQFAERHGLRVGGGQVVAGGELPPGEVGFQAEVGQPRHRPLSFASGDLSSAIAAGVDQGNGQGWHWRGTAAGRAIVRQYQPEGVSVMDVRWRGPAGLHAVSARLPVEGELVP
jgi:hypothetical protein